MPRKKIKKIKDKITKSDLLPESREFLIEKKLEEKKEKKKREIISSLQEEKERRAAPAGDNNEDGGKRLVMWTGVTFFMALIFVFWVYNIKATFKQSTPKNESDVSWDKISGDFRKAMGEVKENISEIKTVLETATSTKESELDKEEIERLKDKLMESNTGTSTEANKTATSSKKIK